MINTGNVQKASTYPSFGLFCTISLEFQRKV